MSQRPQQPERRRSHAEIWTDICTQVKIQEDKLKGDAHVQETARGTGCTGSGSKVGV